MADKRLLPLCLLLTVAVVLPRPAVPATITVNGQTGDAPGTCDLVEAIENAENDDAANVDCAAGSGDDVIDLTVDVLLTESADGDPFAGNGLPPITGAGGTITIEGGNFAIERDAGATDLFRIFSIETDGILTLNEVTLEGGLISNPGADSLGGAIHNGGSLTLTSSTITGNTVSGVDPYPYAYGGGLYNLGTTVISDSTISGNRAEAIGQSTQYFHIAGGGGISNCVVDCPDGSSSLTITSSTLSGNAVESAPAAGSANPRGYSGAIHLLYGELSATNSTLSGNSVTASGINSSAAIGGAAEILEATVVLRNTTLSGNAVAAGGGYQAGATLDFFGLGGGDLSLYGNVLGYPSGAGNCQGVGPSTDGGSNLADDTSCGTIPATLAGLDAVLMDNGGPTQTHALLAGSSAIDAALACGLAVDQRGVPRPAGFCDSGSFERTDCMAPDGDTFDIPDGTMVAAELTVETCSSITLADVDVIGSGHLILRTAGRVEFSDGFEVDGLSARLTVEIDSGIVMPQSDRVAG